MRVQDLHAYEKNFKLAMAIFEISKSFPKEETYSLTEKEVAKLINYMILNPKKIGSKEQL